MSIMKRSERKREGWRLGEVWIRKCLAGLLLFGGLHGTVAADEGAIPFHSGENRDPAFSRGPIYQSGMDALTQSHFDGSMKIYVPRYHSRPYRTSMAIERISVGEPNIADVVLLDPREMLIHGKNVGSTMVMVWYRDLERRSTATESGVEAFEIRVTAERPIRRLDVEVINGINTDVDHSLIQWEW